MKTAFIYTLNDPETGEIRYLGKVDSNPRKRLREHISESRTKKHHRANWIKSLTTRDLRPTLELLDEVPFDEWEFWEREYIRLFRAIGIRLVNGTDGGDGGATMLGKKFTPEHRAAISAGNLGKIVSPQTCAAISASKKGVKLKSSPESLQKKIDASTGRIHSEESRIKRRKKKSKNSSPYHGVSWHVLRGKWRARVNVNSKSIYLGIFSEEIKAAQAYDAAAKIHHGEFAVLNFT